MKGNLNALYPNGFNSREVNARKEQDPIQGFLNAMMAAGLEVNHIDTTGKLKRIKTSEDKGTKKTGWYVFHHGAEFSAGAFGDWRSDEQQTWSSHYIDELSPDQQQRHRAQMEEIRAAKEREQNHVHTEAKAKANETWIAANHAAPDNNYLQRKQIEPLGTREHKGRIVVPVLDAESQIQSLQFIAENGEKRFLTGGKIKGGRFTIGNPSHTIYICEGYSTGASIHMATGDQVICCMNRGNMMGVAEEIRRKHISARIIIAGDNDQFLPEFTASGQPLGNVGEKKAREVANKINCEVKIPQFSDLAEQPTDFNDLACLEGIDSVKEQLGHIAKMSFPLSSIAGREVSQIEWVIDGVFSVGAPAGLFAAGGAGKGYFIQQMAACVATGKDFFGLKVKQGPVLSVYCEDDLDELHRRQKSICDVHDIDYKSLDDVHMISRITDPNSFLITFDHSNVGAPTEFYHRLEAEIARIRPVLVTFDTSGDAFAGNENDKAQVNQLLKGLIGALSVKYNCCFLITGHTPKSNSQFAGHMAWENSVRHRMFIDHNRDTGVRDVMLSKSNRAKEGSLFKLNWRDGCLQLMTDTGFIEGEKARAIQRDTLALLAIFWQRATNVNMSRSGNYAPKQLNDLGTKKKINWPVEAYEEILESLLDEGVIELVQGHNRGKTQTIKINEVNKNE